MRRSADDGTCMRCLARAVTVISFVVLAMMSAPATAALLDDFETLTQWKAQPAEGVDLSISQDRGHTGMAMRLDFDFRGGGGYVIARRDLALTLPPNFAFTFRVRGETPVNNLEFKLIDRSGANVWWFNDRDMSFPREWQQKSIKKRHVQFAWGPAGGGEIREIAAIEIAITAGRGGKGSVWIDDLILEERKPQPSEPPLPLVRASSAVPGHAADNILDGQKATSWRSRALAEDQWLVLDFGDVREYGGMVIDWEDPDHAVAYSVQLSDDGERWRDVYPVEGGNGGRDFVALPDAESRYLRLWLTGSGRGQGYGIADIAIKPYEFSRSPNDFFAAIAADTAEGRYPKYLHGRQSYWTVAGVRADEKEALVNEEGMVEVDRKGFSIEPFLYEDGRLITWRDVQAEQTLAEGYLPIPSVIWAHAGLKLVITALAAGQRGASTLYLRYALRNESPDPRQGRLYLALRPFQVLPPWQSVNLVGGVSPIRNLRYAAGAVAVNDDKKVYALVKPQRFGAVSFSQGSIVDSLETGTLPDADAADDAHGYASGALEYHYALDPGAEKQVVLAVPFHAHSPEPPVDLPADEAMALWDRSHATAREDWEAVLNRVDIALPEAARTITDTLRSTLAYILINQDGPRLQPGSRTYERSWIRDGSLVSAVLLRLGHTEEVRDFIRWYARYQYADGKVPCCVDGRGADPIPEHDSNGQWIYLVMEYYRFTRDIAFLIEMWPYVVKAVDYIEFLRSQRVTEDYKNGEKRVYYGLVPESISHEGYSARPVHSYWDNFFVLRGLKDAASGASILGEESYAQALAGSRDAFSEHLYASVGDSIALHRIDYIPGAVELGDFDVTATAIGVDLLGDLPRLPEPALSRTFERYYGSFRRRRSGEGDGENYTPYEWRIVGALVQMGQQRRGHELMDFFLEDRRPPAWNHWAEIVWRDRDAPRFIGDMPHTWVGAEYIRVLRNLFAYEREPDQALVIGAGLKSDWITAEEGVAVRRLPTYYGTLNYTAQILKDNGLAIRLSGDVVVPPGKIVIRSPLATPIRGATVNGKALERFVDDEVVIEEFPAYVVLHY